MKRSLFVASCVLLVSGLLSSCQKEDKSVVDLANELTAELQQITDLPTANAHAARVGVLNKRLQDASTRVLALNDTSLKRGADSNADHQGASYTTALKELAREVGRVRASFPCATADGGVDKDKLMVAIGAIMGVQGSAAEQKAAGERYLKDHGSANETPGHFPEYYGSESLKEALSYRSSVVAVNSFKFDTDADVPALPAVEPVAEDAAPAATSDAASADDDDDSTSAADDDDSTSAADDEEEDSTAASSSSSSDDDEDSSSDDEDDSSSDDEEESDMDIDI